MISIIGYAIATKCSLVLLVCIQFSFCLRNFHLVAWLEISMSCWSELGRSAFIMLNMAVPGGTPILKQQLHSLVMIRTNRHSQLRNIPPFLLLVHLVGWRTQKSMLIVPASKSLEVLFPSGSIHHLGTKTSIAAYSKSYKPKFFT